MVDSGGIHCDPNELLSHASHVSDVVLELGRASDAANTVTWGSSEALGVLLSFVDGWFLDKEEDLSSKFGQTKLDLDLDAIHLRGGAHNLTASDRNAAGRTDNAGRDLPL